MGKLPDDKKSDSNKKTVRRWGTVTLATVIVAIIAYSTAPKISEIRRNNRIVSEHPSFNAYHWPPTSDYTFRRVAGRAEYMKGFKVHKGTIDSVCMGKDGISSVDLLVEGRDETLPVMLGKDSYFVKDGGYRSGSKTGLFDPREGNALRNCSKGDLIVVVSWCRRDSPHDDNPNSPIIARAYRNYTQPSTAIGNLKDDVRISPEMLRRLRLQRDPPKVFPRRSGFDYQRRDYVFEGVLERVKKERGFQVYNGVVTSVLENDGKVAAIEIDAKGHDAPLHVLLGKGTFYVTDIERPDGYPAKNPVGLLDQRVTAPLQTERCKKGDEVTIIGWGQRDSPRTDPNVPIRARGYQNKTQGMQRVSSEVLRRFEFGNDIMY